MVASIIPNAAAIAESTEPDRAAPKSFVAKYTSPFATLYHELCDEIVRRCQWQAEERAAARAQASGV